MELFINPDRSYSYIQSAWKMSNNRLPFLDVISLIAIISIVFFHGIGSFATGIPNFLISVPCYFGLVLFTLASAYKFYYRDIGEDSKSITSKFYKKRAIRLLKPYFGYSLLALPFLLIFTYLLTYFGNYNNFDQLIITMQSRETYIAFLFGDNFVAVQLWYLMVLLYINLLVGFVFSKFRYKGLLVLCSILFALVYLTATYGNPLNPYFPTKIPIMVDTLQFALVFIIGIAIARVFIDHQYRIILGLFLACIALLYQGYWPFVLPILFFLAMCCLSNYRPLKKEYRLTKYSFQIYLFHLPIILFLVAIILKADSQLNNIYGLILAVVITIALCIIAYEATKKLRLNRLFE